jgi:hypothetical protein
MLGVVTAGSGCQLVSGTVSGRVSAAACEPQMLHVPQPSPPVHALARAWWKAFESAQSALSAASPYLSGIELGQRLRRLGKERSEIAQLLESLARDMQADSGFVRWPADSRKLWPNSYRLRAEGVDRSRRGQDRRAREESGQLRAAAARPLRAVIERTKGER